jgi:hypothetical protein
MIGEEGGLGSMERVRNAASRRLARAATQQWTLDVALMVRGMRQHGCSLTLGLLYFFTHVCISLPTLCADHLSITMSR